MFKKKALSFYIVYWTLELFKKHLILKIKYKLQILLSSYFYPIIFILIIRINKYNVRNCLDKTVFSVLLRTADFDL